MEDNRVIPERKDRGWLQGTPPPYYAYPLSLRGRSRPNVSLQEFLNIACAEWGTKPSIKMPLWIIYIAAKIFELWSLIFKTRAPLTRDFIDIGRVPYFGDTSRMKEDLLPTLKYPTIHEGKETLT